MFVIIYPFVSKYQFVYTHGDSMNPTYQNGEWVLIERKSKLGSDWTPKRFDAVVIIDGENKEIISKRIIGLPGETLEIKGGEIYVNGHKTDGLFSKGNVSHVDEEMIRIPKDYVWLVGDNRDKSWYGILPIEHIRGKIL